MMKTIQTRNRPGFTLVELLVVIVIIAVIAALSTVGLGRMRAAADQVNAVRNIAQLQVANLSYSSDYNGRFVPSSVTDADGVTGGQWFKNRKFLAYFTGDDTVFDKPQNQTIMVPASLLDPIVARSKERLWEYIYSSYGMNAQGLPLSTVRDVERSFRVSQVTDPSRSAAFMTATDMNVRHSSRFRWERSPVEGKTTDQKVAYRHGNRTAVAYYDGSSGLVSLDDIRAIDDKGGANHPFWRADAR